MNTARLILVAALLVACEKKAVNNTTTSSTTAPSGPVVTWKGFSTPESVLHDDADDVYFVSNINGQPLGADNNGFISKLSPDGKVIALKWIESGKNNVTLNAPKGMAFRGDELYVADIDAVRVFDRKSGASVAEVKIPGATFLNDVTSTGDGRILVSDTGSKASGTDAVYAIDKEKKVAAVVKSNDLGAPNGLLATSDGKTWVVTFGSGEVYALDAEGKKTQAKKAPKGALDGIVQLKDDEVLVSSWEGGTIYRGKLGGELKPLIENVTSPADIGIDRKRSRVLVPLFKENEVRAYDVK